MSFCMSTEKNHQAPIGRHQISTKSQSQKWLGIGISLVLGYWCLVIPTRAAEAFRVGTFDIDATPPIGSMMAYDPVTNKWDMGLRARGVVLLGAGEPIVLCAVDWIGIANEGQDFFKGALAQAAGTSPHRVA